MHQDIIDEIFKQYQNSGYVSEDSVFDALINNNVELDQVDYICEILLAMGVIIKNDNVKSTDEDYVLDRSHTDYEEIYGKIIEIDHSLKSLVDKVRKIVPPQNREWIELIPQAQGGNEYARNRLIDMYLRVVLKISLYHNQRYGISLDDAIQDGSIGLITAIDKFELGKQENFGQYAPWWIRQSIMREAEPPTSIMRYPVHYKDRMFAVLDIIVQNGYESFDNLDVDIKDEILTKLEISSEELQELGKYLQIAESIEALVDDESQSLSDQSEFANAINQKLSSDYLKIKIQQIFNRLKEREKEVLNLRYGLDSNDVDSMTLEEVGTIYGVTRERIRQIEAKAIRKLRVIFNKENLDEFYI